MTILGIHIDLNIKATVDINVECNLFGENKYEAVRTVEVYKQLTPEHKHHIDYAYTSDMLKASIDKFFSDLFQKAKSYFLK